MMTQVLNITIALILIPGLVISQTTTKPRARISRQELSARTEAKFLNAIEKGDIAMFYRLLRRGVNVNARRYNRTSALMVAALNKRPEFVAVLLSRGARPNAKNKFGNTALMDAAADGQVEMVKWLLAAGADVRAKNESGWTALMFATNSAYVKQDNYQKVIQLLQAHELKERSPSRRAQQALGAGSPVSSLYS